MASRANAVLHVVRLSRGNEVDHLRDLPRSVCTDAALDRVRAVLTADGLDPAAGVSIQVTDVGQGRAELSAHTTGTADPVRAWVCWEAATADRHRSELSEPVGGGDHAPMRWLSENVLVPWLAIRAEVDEDMCRLLEATAWVLIEEGMPVGVAAA